MKKQKDKKLIVENEQADASQTHIELLTGVILLAFGVYQSILYFGHTAMPNADFPDFFREGRELLSLRMPGSFKHAPVLGLLQNLLYPLAWGSSRELTAGWLLNAIVHPFTVVLFWLVGKRIIGRSAVWFAIIAAINPWTIYSLTDPVIETVFLFFILLTIYLIFRRSRWAYLFASITTMVRYEGAALILAVFVADIIHSQNRRDIIKALGFSALASSPLVIWLALTVITGRGGTTHYFTVLFSKEYAKVFAEPVSGRTGFLLHLKLLWYVAFQPMLVPFPGADAGFADMLLKLSKAAVVIGFVFGCIYAFFSRRWQVLGLLLFFVPYFVLHAYYPYPLPRFHSTIFWIALLMAWFGLQSVGGALTRKAPPLRQIAYAVYIALAIAACAWFVALASHFRDAAAISPVSGSMPYVAMLVTAAIVAARMLEQHRFVPRYLLTASVLCLVIASNQFMLTRLLGDGKREIEFKQLGEWFASTGRPDEKLAVYMDGPTRMFAGKNAQNVIGFPKAENANELAEKLCQQGITYVVWATREGFGIDTHPDYRLAGLDKNIAMLSEPRSMGPYQFVTQLGSNRGFVNVFRLKCDESKKPGM